MRAAARDQVVTARDVGRMLRRGALLAIVTAVAAGTAGFLVSSRSPMTYSAEVGVIAAQPGADLRGMNIIAPSTVEAGVYQSAILDGDVVRRALTRVDGVEPTPQRIEAFLERVRVRVQDAQRSSTIWVEVRHPSPTFAADAVNAIVDELVIWDRERAQRALDRSVTAIERSIEELDGQIQEATQAGDAGRVASLEELRAQRSAELATARETRAGAMVVGLLEPLRSAQPPDEPVGPRVLFTTVVATLLGLVLGYGLQLLRWTFDRRVGDRDDVMDLTGLPVLAEFPPLSRRSLRLSSEAAGFFHTNVALATRGASPRIIAVTSPAKPAEREGVAMSLAENFARSGQRTLLVDADMRHPGVTAYLDLVPQSTVPLDAYLQQTGAVHAPVQIAIGHDQAFDFVPSFTAQRFPVELLNEGFETCLNTWKDAYDAIVIDAAPVVPFADTLAIAPYCSGVVVCASAARSSQTQLEAAVDLLDDPHITLIGIALVEVRDRHAVPAGTVTGARGGPATRDGLKTRVPAGRGTDPKSGRRV